MPEKTVNAYQRFILLRSRCVVIAVCLALLLCPLALTASAAPLDYNDYITNVTVDGDNDIVTVTIPASMTLYEVYVGSMYYVSKGAEMSITVSAGQEVDAYIQHFPDGVLVDNIPSGTTVNVSFYCGFSTAYNTPSLLSRYWYLNSSGEQLTNSVVTHFGYDAFGFRTDYSFVLEKPAGAHSFKLRSDVSNLSALEAGTYELYCYNTILTMSISSLYRLQQETGKTNVILTEVQKQLAENGQTLEEVLQQQEQTNDKLDKLPGQIGDEMQGVIENEKEESKNEGNQFVDQILDALPDPSQDVLAALKGLTDATAYTGTDAVLPIPAIVLPGIDGLFPETEIWGGAEFDFGEYIGMLPPTLLTLVQALFTIAIVLYCVYELKGIISYCLTLRESKGG